ncbi:DUF2182 domain-containing protein [Mycobacteroides franklinii]|uniref:DUF2182 domain-containing protein n=1 Tax=Mycobacteroides franklinii TaxID=948102 RepID=A0A4R8QZR7_9MYCO|nr:DUF2182 domain-containing protein [Mycobacteroides franklinii]TDZ45821.1 hypothetical protein CCUG64054_01471 [Mycobacteroides franklinii]TDZ49311.1 hypothetical protein CCUG63697_03847 [Mycobacteroides franklinii]TDZ59491.1 hypothetical protein CCUG63696_01473 [Mycobacteroides franklinii]TDZ67006.1 hypothetical protein CCUG63695_00836 [Mycobacteroides franklinii]TDZ72930.1 hypothetical protein CCUG64056_01471 [Mycobacteroides franklinii]
MVANAIQRVRELTAGTYTGIAAAIILLSWLGFALLPQHSGGHRQAPAAEHMHGMHHTGMAPMAAPVVHHPVLWIAIASWVVMTIAMMGPATLPSIQYIEQNMPRGRRGGAVVGYTVVWLAVWTVIGVVITVAQSAVVGPSPWWLFAGALVIAALWQLTPLKCRALGDCHKSRPLPPTGWPAADGVMRFGAFGGWACVRSCWAVMVAMALAPTAHILWMVPLTAAVTWERFTQNPRRTARILAGVFVVAAVAVGVFAAIP